MTYDGALASLRRALVFGINPSLDGITGLCDALGKPQDAFAVVQVTGTNGKTSTARITAALLRAEGRSVGLYTSPELTRYPERIEVDGEVASDEEFARAVSAAVGAAESLRPGAQGSDGGFTEFELLTAAALWLFRERGVDTAVLEVGMGGRWDATSVAAPAVAVITGVGLDHTRILGDTLEAIAAEKAAIIRPASAPVLGPGTVGLDSIFLAQAERVGTHARAVRAEGEPTPVAEELTVRFRVTSEAAAPGTVTALDVTGVHGAYANLAIPAPAYQAANVATAVAAAEAALGRALDTDAARGALAILAIPGRFELVRDEPPVIVDGSHNPQAAAVLATAIRAAWPDPTRRPTVLLGVLDDKDAEGIVRALVPAAGAIAVTQPCSPRALPVERLAEVVAGVTREEPQRFASVAEALEALSRPGQAGLVVTGSLTTAGEARALIHRSAT